MKKLLFVFLFVFGYGGVYAQQVTGRVFVRDANGLDIKSRSANIDHVEFLFHPTYLSAALFTKAGKLSGNLKYKLLLQENRLFYQDSDGADMEVVSPIYRIAFEMPNGTFTVFEKDFDGVDNLDNTNFYQVVTDGKAKLLLDTKFVPETKQVFGSGMVTTLEKQINYFGAINAKIIKLTKAEHAVELMQDKSTEISTFISKEKIKFKKQSDLEKLFNYYNTLVK